MTFAQPLIEDLTELGQAAGDLIVFSGAGVAARLAAGAVGSTLGVSATGVLSWLPEMPQIEFHVHTPAAGASGFGSTNTARRRFSVVEANLGGWSDNATLGGRFVPPADGWYQFLYTDGNISGGVALAVSLHDGSSLVSALALANRLGLQGAIAGHAANCPTRPIYLTTSSVVQAAMLNSGTPFASNVTSFCGWRLK